MTTSIDRIIPIACDHRGVALKAQIISWLAENGFTAVDLGTNNGDRCDASDFALKLAEEFKAERCVRGILICGTGQAMAMTANRYGAIRAALCSETTTARLTREHNDANVLVLGADIIGPALALDCVKTFVTTSFLGGRYGERRDKLTALGGL